jgi:hypothetical protein
MRRIFLSGIVALAAAAGLVTACSGDDNSVGSGGTDGGQDATRDTGTGDAGPADAGATDGGDSGIADASSDAGPSFFLLSYSLDGYVKTSFTAYRLGDLSTAGSFEYPAYGTHVNGATSPWVLEGAGDNVRQMSALEPWKVVSTWSVATPRTNDAGTAVSNPSGIAEVGGKAYVPLFDRNLIAVLDMTKGSDGGAPTKLIDVSKWVQPGDGDGHVDMSDVVYVPSQSRLYVLLGNIDLNRVDPQGFFLLCSGDKSAVGAIDVTTDAIVDLGPTSVASGALPLKGVSPLGLTYDAKNDRILVVNAGCNDPPAADAGADAGAGPLRGRVIEEVKLTAKTTTVLLDANALPYPGRLVYADETHAFMTFSGTTYAWNPTTSALGSTIPTAPDYFEYDSTGALLGPKATFLADGGVASVDLISVRTDDGGAKVVRAGAVSKTYDYFEAISIWPKR